MSDAAPDPVAFKKERLVYVLMAGSLALVALCWFGNVRILGALGFAQVDPLAFAPEPDL